MLRYILFFFISISHLFAAPCPDLHRIEEIGEELEVYFKPISCPLELQAEDILHFVHDSLPEIMNKNFLGVEPPPNWQLTTELLISTCYPAPRNLCDKKVQQEITQCFANTTPLLLVQYGGWLSDHCETLHEHLIVHWPASKAKLVEMIQAVNKLHH